MRREPHGSKRIIFFQRGRSKLPLITNERECSSSAITDEEEEEGEEEEVLVLSLSPRHCCASCFLLVRIKQDTV